MDNEVTILLLSKNGEKTRSFNTKISYLKFFAFSFIILGAISAFSSFYLYKYYNFAKTTEYEIELAQNQLSSTVAALSQNITNNSDGDVDIDVDANIVKRLIMIENKLLKLQDVLEKKGINKKLFVGGNFEPPDRLSSQYLEFLEKDIDRMNVTLASYPIGKPSRGNLSSGFGHRKDPFKKGMAFHSGIDLNANNGNSVIATADGIVEKAGWNGGYGRCIVIRHKNGYKTLYAHLSKIKVKKGQRVKSGDLIGNVGSSGRSTGPHLHYEVIKDKKKVNPFPYISLS